MSRSLADLESITQGLANAFEAACVKQGVSIIFTSTRRTFSEQTALYDQGRTAPGHIVTWAQAGQSPHNYGLAFDVVGMRNSKPVWIDVDPMWELLGAIGVTVGLEWGGNFPAHKVDKPHFQRPNWKVIAAGMVVQP